MKNIKRVLCVVLVVLALVMLLSLAACSKKEDVSTTPPPANVGTVNEEAEQALEDPAVLVKGRLDVMYLGEYSERYTQITGRSEEDCRNEYEENLLVNAEALARRFGADVEYLSDELKAELVELYKEIFTKAQYTVSGSSQIDDSNYLVTVEVSPINLVEQMEAAREEWFAPFDEKYGATDFTSLSEEEARTVNMDRARYIIDLAKDKLASLGYLDAESLPVQVTKGENGTWNVVDSDVYAVDERVVNFP